jgi:CheY-like chemotaxis protein
MLVEDDPVNQVVMEAVLRDLGVQCSLPAAVNKRWTCWSTAPSISSSWTAVCRA